MQSIALQDREWIDVLVSFANPSLIVILGLIVAWRTSEPRAFKFLLITILFGPYVPHYKLTRDIKSSFRATFEKGKTEESFQNVSFSFSTTFMFKMIAGIPSRCKGWKVLFQESCIELIQDGSVARLSQWFPIKST